ncbi:paramyosin-like [Leptopilina boulardi]|uniref:paramyosin-like n=1 Tax=Leptopilina boulardi TaxID=63433 RepID=UPI0021F6240E|nr:paramyosin-like [Leptopilina boulardi]
MFLTNIANLSPEISRNSFNFEDNLTYIDEEFPSDIVFPHSLNTFLRKKIQEITSENGCLQKSLQDAEEKLETLLQSSTNISENSFSSETKNKVNSKEAIFQSEIINKMESKSFCKDTTFKENKLYQNLKRQLSRKNDQIKILNDKLDQTNDDILVLKNMNLTLKQEVTKAQKGSFYRKTIVDEDLRNLEKKRKQQIENLTKELKELEISFENMKIKLSASKARIKMLENELIGAKKNIALLNEKKIYNDQLIEELNSKLKYTKNELLNSEVDIQNQKIKFDREKDAMKNELESLQVQNNQLRQKLEEC